VFSEDPRLPRGRPHLHDHHHDHGHDHGHGHHHHHDHHWHDFALDSSSSCPRSSRASTSWLLS